MQEKSLLLARIKAEIQPGVRLIQQVQIWAFIRESTVDELLVVAVESELSSGALHLELRMEGMPVV